MVKIHQFYNNTAVNVGMQITWSYLQTAPGNLVHQKH